MAVLRKREPGANERTVTKDGITITVIDKHKNRHRDEFRQLASRLVEAGLPEEGVPPFAAIVYYVLAVNGDIWRPPDRNAPTEVLVSAFWVWYDEIDTEVTDLYSDVIWGATEGDVATAPNVPLKALDPNS